MNAFDKVVGYDAIKTEFLQVVDMIHHPDYYKKLGARMPKGILLDGAPGLGKTLICKCFIEEAGIPAYTVRRDSGDEDFINKITKAFADARDNAPAIVFLDDMDKFANEDRDHRDCPEYVAVQSGIDACKDVTVLALATTNDSDDLPDSLIRTGRFDRFISVPRPSMEDAVKILRHYMQDKNIDPDLNLDDVVKMTGTDACSVLETVMNEAAIYAAFSRSEYVKMEHILAAVLRLTYHCPDNTTITGQAERQMRAAHEAGHVCVAEVLAPGCIGLASIKSSGRSDVGGFVHRCRPLEKRSDDILISLGGKVAVEMLYPGVADGCSGDLQRALSNIEVEMTENAGLGYQLMDGCRRDSDGLLHAQEAASRAELARQADVAKALLLANREFFDKVRNALAEKETLLFSELQEIKKSCAADIAA